MDTQLKKGVLDMCMLLLVNARDLYGYDAMKTMQSYFPEVDGANLYAVLRRLSKDLLVTTYTKKSESGPERKYYSITQHGKERLVKLCNDWAAIDNLLRDFGYLELILN
ncbi:MAG: PadR family transcriptional regulator [Clostridiales bacterium]|nr:PadR family transcriptional regulator [Clostridiales bacterium]